MIQCQIEMKKDLLNRDMQLDHALHTLRAQILETEMVMISTEMTYESWLYFIERYIINQQLTRS